MATVTGFRTPEEAALDLELPLLGNLSAGPEVDGPVAAAWPSDDRVRRDVERICDRLLESPLLAEGSVGVLGDVPASLRAEVSAALAAGLASERTTVLIDADLRAAHLSFDDRRRAQEGLVDVLRYGVRSPRVVSPTLTPGLALLPVGSRTLDFEGTYGAESVPGLFAELSRSGEILFVNGPGPRDVDAAEPLLAHVEGWILLHGIGVSDPERTRALRDRCGRSRCLGILVLTGAAGAAAAAPAAGEPELEEEGPAPAVAVDVPDEVAAASDAAAPAPAAVEPEDRLPAALPVAPAAVATPPVAAPPVRAEGAPGDARPEPRERSRSRAPWIAGGVGIAAIVALVIFWPRPRTERAPETEVAEPPVSGVPAAPEGDDTGTVPETTPESAAETVAGPLPGPAAGEADAAIGAGAEPGIGAADPVAATGTAPSEDAGPAAAGPPSAAAGGAPSVAAPAPAATQSTPPPPAPTASAEAGAAAMPPAAAPLGAMVFGVHLESVKSEDGAAKEAAALAAQGTPAFIHRTEIPDKGTWWRVYAGPWGTREEADAAAAAIKAAGREYAQVHRLRREEVGTVTGREDR